MTAPYRPPRSTDVGLDLARGMQGGAVARAPEEDTMPFATETIEIFEPSGKRWATFYDLSNVKLTCAPGGISFEGTDVNTGMRSYCRTSLPFFFQRKA